MPTAFRTSTILLLLALGCGHAQNEVDRPQASLSTNAAAQVRFRALRAAWFAGSTSERRRLEPELRDFLVRYPNDEQSDMVRVLVAFDCVSRGALQEARVLIAQVREHTGSVRDFAQVAEAYARLRDSKPDAAWQVLEPLAGKIIDADERMLYGELRLRAAAAARRYERALDAAQELLAEAPSEARGSLEQLVREQFQAAPKAALVASLEVFPKAEGDDSPSAAAREWLRRMVRERLIALAVKERDASLARSLLDSAPAALRASKSGSELVGIAGGAQTAPLILGRSVGVALSLGNPDARRRSASLSAGLLRGLGVPDATTEDAAVHLLSQDDGGAGIVEALRELSSEGAAILVAGVDSASADAAARFAEDNGIAVILVQPPEGVPGPYQSAFVLGESTNAEQAALDAELSRRSLIRIARVGRAGEPCDAPLLAAGGPRFGVEQWRRERVAALLVLGPAACARDVARDLRSSSFAPELALGLEAADFVHAADAPRARFALGAGRFPLAERPDAAKGSVQPPPDWYEALGHDAALLARAALRDFPNGRVDDAAAVRELHARARRALSAARAPLWTSESSGFSEGHVLRRTLTVVSPDPAPKKSP